MNRLYLLVTLILMIYSYSANAACPENGLPITDATSEQDPAQFIVSDICINWAAPTDIVTHHYHVYENGLMVANPKGRSHLLAMTEQRTVYEIVVRAAAEDVETNDTQVSNPLFVEWVSRQCLEGAKVITCP